MLTNLLPFFIKDIYCYSQLIINQVYISIPLLLYSHLPIAIITIVVGIFVWSRNRSLEAKIFFYLTLVFFIFTLGDLTEWFAFFGRNTVMFVRSIIELIDPLLFILSSYLLFVLVKKRDVKLIYKIFWLLPMTTLFIRVLLSYNLIGYNWQICEVVESSFSANYIFYIDFFYLITAIIFAIWSIIKSKENKKEVSIISFGVCLFMIAFFVMEYVFTGYILGGAFDYSWFVYAFFGMPILIAVLAFMVVRYKTFNIKLLGAQVLVWSLLAIIGAEFFFIQSNINQILTAITLIISGWLGLLIIRSVKKEALLVEDIEVANAGQTNLIHIMNHQIKGYLGKDKNIFAELLTDDYGKVPDEAKSIIEQGLESADKGQRYVTDILRGASAENGTLPYDMKDIDFKSLVMEAVEKGKETAEKKGLKFDYVSQNGNYNMVGDPTHLGEAIRNLVDNSIYYTPTGSVTVSLSVKGKVILLKIKDTGVGIKDSDKERMFRAGGVGKDSIKINVSSSGYGLVFAKNVIEKHNGKIWYESDGAGKGTTFFVELPGK